MAEPMLLHVAEKLLDKLVSLVVNEVSMAWGLKDELEKLQEILKDILAVIEDAEKRESQETTLRVWLDKLKDVLYDSENVLDEFECEAWRKKVTKAGSLRGKVCHFFSCYNSIAFRFKMGHRIRKTRERLDEINIRKNAFNLNQQPGSGSGGASHTIWRETHSHVQLSEIIGREKDRDAIVERLKCQDDIKNPYIVSIVGIGGLGKTTLAKMVYNDSEVQFDKKIWVCVSVDLNLKQILQKIVKILDRTAAPSIDNMDLEQLQENLRNHLKGKKFLLVLDDVWNVDHRQWNDLSDLLTGGNRGSSIIVTTRTSTVASTVGTCYEHKLEALPHDSCMAILKKANTDALARSIDPEILEIVGQIVEKCGGVPLVAKALGSSLRSNADVGYWRSIKDKDIFTVLQRDRDVLPIIKLSYDNLPRHLKRCLHFCSLFPKDCEFDNICLGGYWKSVGLIKLTGNQNQQEVAEHYMKELLARSFFQEFEEYGVCFRFKMHNLMHELAISVAQNECSAVNLDSSCIPRQVQHVLIKADTFNSDEKPRPVPSLLNKENNCRSFMLRHAKSGISKELVKACISSSKFLRLLDLEGSDFEVMTSSIGTLRHLRHLSIERNRKIRRLPSSICNLQSLQVLWLDGCESLEELPKYMWKLINLEQLSITTQQKSLKTTGIGYLVSLKYLWIYGCNNLECLFEEVDVRRLTSLRALFVNRCQSLTSIPVKKFKFFSLEILEFNYCRKLDISMDEEFRSLTLRTLALKGLPLMSSLPEWFLSCAKTLEFLLISDCGCLEELPEGLKNFRKLKRLEIEDCSKVASLPDGMQSLTGLRRLEISDCDELKDRCQRDGLDWNKIAHIPEIEIDGERINQKKQVA